MNDKDQIINALQERLEESVAVGVNRGALVALQTVEWWMVEQGIALGPYPTEEVLEEKLKRIRHYFIGVGRSAATHQIWETTCVPWREIGTAPLDGCDILLCEYRHGQYSHVEIGSWERIDGGESGWKTLNGILEEPTHWMPCPPEPSALHAKAIAAPPWGGAK